MLKAIRRLYKKYSKTFALICGALILIPLLCFALSNLYYTGKIFPGILIASVDVSGLSPSEAAGLLSKKITPPEAVMLVSGEQEFTLATKQIDLNYDFSASATEAYNLARTGLILTDWRQRINLLFRPNPLPLSPEYNEEEVQKFISVVSGQISVIPIAPSIVFNRPNVVVNRGTPGTEVDQEILREAIHQNLIYAKGDKIEIPINTVGQALGDDEAQTLKARSESLVGKSLTLTFEFESFEINDNQLLGFLGTRGGFDWGKIRESVNKIAGQINRPPQNPKFAFEGGRVTEFQPALDGTEVKADELEVAIIESLTKLESEDNKNIQIAVPTTNTPSQISTNEVNNLGINELIGRGTSTYYHSIPSRVHNISVSANRINGTLIAPGETFSFNDVLGDVSSFTGYQQAYIIKDGKTVLGDGGGVCQVSSTLFRAILNAGLPITERQAHAYRVSYYEQGSSPGLDATVYSPSPDLKFRNDTPAHILIQAKPDTKNYSLVFELYGTSDGRVATITKPVVTNVSAPPEDLYQDDPTLPSGTVKQIEYKAWGARVTFNYKVTRNGEELINKTFISNYRPWQAVYLRGTGPTQ
jgi:vancomycin resistance protein YoaR